MTQQRRRPSLRDVMDRLDALESTWARERDGAEIGRQAAEQVARRNAERRLERIREERAKWLQEMANTDLGSK